MFPLSPPEAVAGVSPAFRARCARLCRPLRALAALRVGDPPPPLRLPPLSPPVRHLAGGQARLTALRDLKGDDMGLRYPPTVKGVAAALSARAEALEEAGQAGALAEVMEIADAFAARSFDCEPEDLKRIARHLRAMSESPRHGAHAADLATLANVFDRSAGRDRRARLARVA